MFSKVLVANRGEIAVQIIRVLHDMGIKAVAVYSTADRDSLFVRLADEAICVGDALPTASYLNMQNILSAAVLTACDAIHPGYGFLSENPKFAERCAESQITFIGPDAELMAIMGDKARARETMRAAGVPVIPGSEDVVRSVAEAEQIGHAIGFPLLLKAAAGGGGKGIRRVEDMSTLKVAFQEAQQEALASFGDDSMYIEKVITQAKHIEVQVVADTFSNIVTLPERDCSMQRKHQKVIEESPCALLTDDERQRLMQTVSRAVAHIGYTNTGTFEFLMDDTHQFYFMEMNTRLQVEHTISEAVTGLELIKAQLLVAAGEPLPFKQSDVQLSGHAIECRLNAEDPAQDFMPQPGKLQHLYFPVGTLGVRIDSGIVAGDAIQPFYDSMIAKLIVHGETREEAIAKMQRVLQETTIDGVKTNKAYLSRLLMTDDFQNGRHLTTTIETLKSLPLLVDNVDVSLDHQQLQTQMNQVPDEMMTRCPKCHQDCFTRELGKYKTCPNCGYGFRLTAYERADWLFDNYRLMDDALTVPEQFLEDGSYQQKVAVGKDKTALNESVMTGIGSIDGLSTAFGIMDPFFVMGSLGSMTGEKITRLFETATAQRLPVVMFTASGGARMQEGIHSLMQMAKTSQAVAKHHEAGLFYLVVLCDPTTGGVTASYAMQGDIILAETQALVGFAGRRVIEQTTLTTPPDDFQSAETVLKNGFIDAVLPREDIRSAVVQLLQFHHEKEVAMDE